jgi:integrase
MATRGKGEGSIFKDARGLWTVAVELPSHDGKRRRKVIRSKDKRVVVAKLSELKRDLEKLGDLPTTTLTVKQWMTYWLDQVARKRVRPNTASGYRSVIQNQIVPEIGAVRLDKLQPSHVRKVHDRIINTLKDSKKPEKGTLSPTYALNAHRVMSKAFTDAEREGRLNRNPAKLTDAPRKARPELNALDVAEAVEVIRLVVDAFDATGEYDQEPARWATYLLTGARRGEVLGLETSRVGDVLDLSWQLQRITDISKAPADYEYRKVMSNLYWTRPKSQAGWRIIPLVDPLRTILATHLAKAPANEYGLLFTNDQGYPIDPDNETKRWPKALAANSITDKKIRLHDLRHTTVDLLYEAEVPEDIIMEIVGHSTRTTTRGYKTRGNQKRLDEAMSSLSGLLTVTGVNSSESHLSALIRRVDGKNTETL